MLKKEMELLVSSKVKMSAILDMAKMLSKPFYQFIFPLAHMGVAVAYNTGFSDILTSSNLIGVKWYFIFISLRLSFYSYVPILFPYLRIARAYPLPIFLLSCFVLLLICKF